MSTVAQKSAQKRYKATPQGKAVRKAANERYYAKIEAKAKRAIYERTRNATNTKVKEIKLLYNRKSDVKERRKAYRSTSAMKAARVAYDHAYYLEHKERRKILSRNWDTANCEQRRAINRRNEHKRRCVEGHYTEVQWQDRLAFYGFRCYLCGVDWFSLPLRDRTIDHVIPVSKGGTNWPSNLRPACRSCNSQKHAKVMI